MDSDSGWLFFDRFGFFESKQCVEKGGKKIILKNENKIRKEGLRAAMSAHTALNRSGRWDGLEKKSGFFV